MQVLKMPSREKPNRFDLGLIETLLDALSSEKIQYCHWKSNWKIDKWLTGDGDLDLLVTRRDVGRFTEILHRLGFKKVLTPPEMEIPGILNYYGFDVSSNKLIHVHAHYQLFFGHDLTKNFHLPIEESMIERSIRYRGIFVADAELEFIYFVVRMILKTSVLEHFARLSLGKSAKHNGSIREEYRYLEAKADPGKLKQVLSRDFRMIEAAFFEKCCESLAEESSILKRVLLKLELETMLSPYGRMPRSKERIIALRNRFSAVYRRLFAREKSLKHFETGGVVIAIIGGDGAGKTTCVNEIYRWLAKKFQTRRFHLGKPPKSISTLFAAAVLSIERKLKGKRSNPTLDEDQSLPQQIRWACTARDRYKLYRRIRRLAANGSIVICDRYPLPELKLMDGPKINPKAGSGPLKGRIQNWLSNIETDFYSMILPPDEMFVLRVDPEIAVIRKTDESKLHVFPRSNELWNVNWDGISAKLIDAERPLADVLSDLKKSIWEVL